MILSHRKSCIPNALFLKCMVVRQFSSFSTQFYLKKICREVFIRCNKDDCHEHKAINTRRSVETKELREGENSLCDINQKLFFFSQLNHGILKPVTRVKQAFCSERHMFEWTSNSSRAFLWFGSRISCLFLRNNWLLSLFYVFHFLNCNFMTCDLKGTHIDARTTAQTFYSYDKKRLT